MSYDDSFDASASEKVAEEYDRLRGRLCGLVESWGLPERQERGMIQTLKSLTYDSQRVVDELVQPLD